MSESTHTRKTMMKRALCLEMIRAAHSKGEGIIVNNCSLGMGLEARQQRPIPVHAQSDTSTRLPQVDMTLHCWSKQALAQSKS